MNPLAKFWKIYKATRRAQHRRELRAGRTIRAAYRAVALTRAGAA
jgi:hypothetical protein